MNKEERIKIAQKIYLRLREIHQQLAIVQQLRSEIKLEDCDRCTVFADINNDVRKYHDQAREYEREQQKL